MTNRTPRVIAIIEDPADRGRAAVVLTMLLTYPVYWVVNHAATLVRLYWWLLLGGSAVITLMILTVVRYLRQHRTPLHLHPKAAEWLAAQGDDPLAAAAALRANRRDA